MKNIIEILVDADACPVREECIKVALRHKIHVTFISNHFLRLPEHKLIKRISVAKEEFDAADDALFDLVSPLKLVVTSDILLADRCLKSSNLPPIVMKPNGVEFTESSIGSTLATRAIMQDLRSGIGGKDGQHAQIGGQAAFSKNDRSQFLAHLHEAILRLMREEQSRL